MASACIVRANETSVSGEASTINLAHVKAGNCSCHLEAEVLHVFEN